MTVEASVVVFNHPQHRGEALDMKGQSGEVVSVLNDWKGRVIRPTLPVIGLRPLQAHFRADELTQAGRSASGRRLPPSTSRSRSSMVSPRRVGQRGHEIRLDRQFRMATVHHGQQHHPLGRPSSVGFRRPEQSAR